MSAVFDSSVGVKLDLRFARGGNVFFMWKLLWGCSIKDFTKRFCFICIVRGVYYLFRILIATESAFNSL